MIVINNFNNNFFFCFFCKKFNIIRENYYNCLFFHFNSGVTDFKKFSK